MKANRAVPVALVMALHAQVAGLAPAVALEMSAADFQKAKARRFS